MIPGRDPPGVAGAARVVLDDVERGGRPPTPAPGARDGNRLPHAREDGEWGAVGVWLGGGGRRHALWSARCAPCHGGCPYHAWLHGVASVCGTLSTGDHATRLSFPNPFPRSHTPLSQDPPSSPAGAGGGWAGAGSTTGPAEAVVVPRFPPRGGRFRYAGRVPCSIHCWKMRRMFLAAWRSLRGGQVRRGACRCVHPGRCGCTGYDSAW